jgi:hypothetical protein
MTRRLNSIVDRRKRMDAEPDATTVARGANRAELEGAASMGLVTTD